MASKIYILLVIVLSYSCSTFNNDLKQFKNACEINKNIDACHKVTRLLRNKKKYKEAEKYLFSIPCDKEYHCSTLALNEENEGNLNNSLKLLQKCCKAKDLALQQLID